jgi:hypothetical protein
MRPFGDSLTLHLTVAPEQVRAALLAQVRSGPLVSSERPGPSDQRPLRGTVGEASFEVVRRAQFSMSFTPVMKGQVRATGGGTEVRVTFSLPRVMAWFLVGWSLLAFVPAALLAISLDDPLGSVNLLGFLALPLVAPLIAGWTFWLEAKRGKALLTTVLSPLPTGALRPEAGA